MLQAAAKNPETPLTCCRFVVQQIYDESTTSRTTSPQKQRKFTRTPHFDTPRY